MIIIGFVVLLAVLTLGNRSVGGRFILLDLERKETSAELASACVQVAVIALVNDPLYTPPTSPYPVPVGMNSCDLILIGHDGSGISKIQAHATVSGATTNVEVLWDEANERINSWQELPAF